MPDRLLNQTIPAPQGTIESGAWIRPGLGLILDMDGVVIDSNPVHRQAWTAYNRQFGIEMTDAMHERMYGRRNDEIVRDFLGAHLTPDDVTAHGAAKEALYRTMIGGKVQQHLVPGVQTFVRRHAGLPVGLATNAEPANVDFLLRATELAPYFAVILTGKDVERPKPDPQIYLKAASRLGLAPCNCIIFEDSHAGVEAARLAGARAVGVRTTHRSLRGVAFEIDDFSGPELESWLRSQKPVV